MQIKKDLRGPILICPEDYSRNLSGWLEHAWRVDFSWLIFTVCLLSGIWPAPGGS